MKLVYLNDTNMSYEDAEDYFEEAATWAKENCVSFVNHKVVDVSDVSYINDQIAEYKFNDPKDAVWFTLRWL